MCAMDRIIDQSSDQLSIDTPELVAIQMPLAGIGSRFIAVLIDTAIWLAGMAVLWLAVFLLLPGIVQFSKLSGQWALAIYGILLFLFNWGYFTLFEAFGNGQTPGKRVARIRVIKSTGRAIGVFESMARNFIRPIDQVPGCYAVGVIAMFATRQHQRLGDLAAGTLVVRDRVQESPASGPAGRTFTSNIFAAPSPMPEPHSELSLPADGIARLSAKDLEVLEGFFSRRLDMSLSTRESLARRIAGAIQAKSGLEPPAGASIETFLEITARQLRDVARLR
jgi:uncharacterized RDD family membrane protein YckC